MLKFVFSPRWFYGIDIISAVIALLITLLIGIFSYKIFKFSKDRKYKYLSLSFITLATAFCFKILTNLNVFYEVTKQTKFGSLVLTYTALESSDLFITLGFIGYRVLFLSGFMGLFWLLYKHRDKKLFIIMFWLILVATWMSLSNYFFFHATAILFIALLFWYYFRACLTSRKKKTLGCVKNSYLLLMVSQISFIFVFVNSNFYVIAETLQALGFLLLLYTLVRVLKHTKK